MRNRRPETTELEFLDRLERELTAGPTWSEVRGVLSSRTEPSLAGNELLVYPAGPHEDGTGVPALRIVAEPLIVRGRQFPEPSRRSDVDRLENIAALAAELHERMLTNPRGQDEHWPGGYRYHPFGGFPRWWAYLALCGDLFDRLAPADEDWPDAVIACAEQIWDETCRERGPLSPEHLESLIRSVFRERR